MRHIRIGEGTPRDCLRVDVEGEFQQGARGCDFRHVLGHVGELVSTRDVATCVHVAARCAAALVDDDPVVVAAYAGCRQVQALDVGHASGCDENGIGFHLDRLRIISHAYGEAHPVIRASYRFDAG